MKIYLKIIVSTNFAATLLVGSSAAASDFSRCTSSDPCAASGRMTMKGWQLNGKEVKDVCSPVPAHCHRPCGVYFHYFKVRPFLVFVSLPEFRPWCSTACANYCSTLLAHCHRQISLPELHIWYSTTCANDCSTLPAHCHRPLREWLWGQGSWPHSFLSPILPGRTLTPWPGLKRAAHWHVGCSWVSSFYIFMLRRPAEISGAPDLCRRPLVGVAHGDSPPPPRGAARGPVLRHGGDRGRVRGLVSVGGQALGPAATPGKRRHHQVLDRARQRLRQGRSRRCTA